MAGADVSGCVNHGSVWTRSRPRLGQCFRLDDNGVAEKVEWEEGFVRGGGVWERPGHGGVLHQPKAVAMRVTRDVALLMRKKRRACSGEIGAAYVSLAPHLQGRVRHLHEQAGTRACAALQTPVDAKTCRTECLSTERAACSGAPCSVAAPTDQSGMVDRSLRSC